MLSYPLIKTIADKDYHLGCEDEEIEGVCKISNDPIELKNRTKMISGK